MHRFRLRGWAAAGVIALTAGAATADPPASDPPNKPLLSRLNPFAQPDPGPRVRPVAVGPLSEEMLLAALQSEKDAYARRVEVCLRLKEIALQKGDDKLEAQANELESRATAVYRERVARLGVKGVGPLPSLPPSNPAAVASLDKALGSGVAKTPLDGTKKPTGTATAKTSQFKEVAP